MPTTSATTAIPTAPSTAPEPDKSNPNCAPLTPGALAGIVVVVVLIYVLSLLLTAFLVSYYTKKGVLDLDKLIFGRIPFAKIGRRARDSAQLTQSPAETNEYIEHRQSSDIIEHRQSSVYMQLQGPNPGHTPTDDPTYMALESVSRLPSDSNEPPPTSNNLALPQEEGKPPHSPTTTSKAAARSRKRDEKTEPNKLKPKITREKPKSKTVDDAVYENAASMKLSPPQ